MELFIAIGGALVASIVAWRAYEFSRTRRELGDLTSDPSPPPDAPAEDGEPSRFGGWHFLDPRSGGDEGYERWAYRSTVQGVLPPWLIMDYCARRPTASRPFLPEALFGPDALEALPEAWRVIAEHGDLVVQSEEHHLVRVPHRPLAEVDAMANALTRGFRARGLERFEAALVEAVDVQGEPEALRLLCQHFAGSSRVDPRIRAALRHEIAAVRVVAARHLGAAGHGTLFDLARDPELPVEVRREACHTLAEREDFEALLDVAVSASSGVEEILADALARATDPRVEAAVLPFLEHRSEVVVEAAAGALAQRGSGASLAALKAALARRPSERLRTALRVARDLVTERATAARGGLSLSEAPAPAEPEGRVSLPPAGGGQLSPTRAPDDDAHG